MSTQSESIGVYVPVSELVPWDQNPRLNESAVDEVAKSIKRFGFASPIIARTADNMVIAGHTRLLAAKKIGLKSVPVRFMDLDLNDAQLLALADNKIGEIADWDETKLGDILASLNDQDLSGLGWSDDELDALIDHHEPVELNGNPDHVPEVEEDAITQEGDLWILGNHRLLCGDSTKEEDVGRLMAGEKADMVFTDPPYGINMRRSGKIKGDGSMMEAQNIIEKAVFLSEVFSKKDSSWYFWIGFRAYSFAELQITKYRNVCNCIVWIKPSIGLGKIGYRFQHELCLFSGQVENRSLSDVWKFGRDSSSLHPTMKPVDLVCHALENSSKNNSKILDLFGGSGSTLIACEQTNRKCFMMELDPQYCDVIIRRWQDLTGKEAVKEDGIKFNDITDIPW